jgi:hypothetical protein
MQLAAAAVRPGLSAASITADFSMQAADGGADAAAGVRCSIVGLQAKRATAAVLVQEVGAPGAVRRAMEEPEDIDEVRAHGMHCKACLKERAVLCARALPVEALPEDLLAHRFTYHVPA